MLTPTLSGDQMAYWERVRSVGYRLLAWAFGNQLSDKIDRMYRRKYGADFPGVQQIAANVSLVFVNANPFFEMPRPTSRKTIYVGGIVEKKPKPLSPVRMCHNNANTHTLQAVQQIFDANSRGVILFSFGSVADTTKMTGEMKRAFLTAFSNFPEYQFIWKIELSNNESRLSSHFPNVHTFDWVDQVGILGKQCRFLRLVWLLSSKPSVLFDLQAIPL